jgi:catechol 2,3-dioxygenase-like lactoylglutathione lyase family enzyme
MEKIFSGIQQIGIGVPNVHQAWDWYRKNFGMDVKVFEEAATADLMIKYTGNVVQSRHAVLAINMQGGGGFEIWQFTSRTPQAKEEPITIGDLGIFACKLKCPDIEKSFNNFDKNFLLSNSIEIDIQGERHFWVKDAYNNIFQICEYKEFFSKPKFHNIGGVLGAVIGVSDMDKSLVFYKNVLGLDIVLADEVSDSFKDYGVLPNRNQKFRRVILTHSNPRRGGFSQLLGSNVIELVQDLNQQRKSIFENRMWGDLGFIHLCFDVFDMNLLKKNATKQGFPFTVDSTDSFDMGEAAGHFSYIEDPDKTLIEFVETHKVPIVKKMGLYLNLKSRDKSKPLSRLMIKGLGLNRKK